MRRTLFDRLRELTYPSTYYGWWLALETFWYVNNKLRIVLAGSALLVLLITFLVMQQINAARTAQLAEAQNQELQCLTLNVYHEARGEPRAGQLAVAEVTLNRVASRRYPDTICEVVYQQRWDRIRQRYVGAFSWTEIETRLNARARDERAWQQAREVAELVFHGRHEPSVAQAMYYHANYIRPSWSRQKTRIASIGRHIFYE